MLDLQGGYMGYQFGFDLLGEVFNGDDEVFHLADS